MDAALISRIDRLVADSDFSGVVQVVDAGRIVYERASGLLDRTRGVALGMDGQLAIASGTKAFTALATMSLVTDGLLSLETPVHRVLAGEAGLVDDAVTVRHLLAHTSGVGDYVDESVIEDIEDFVLEVPTERLACPADFLPLLRGRQASFAPGAGFAYSNSGYVLLALVIEAVSGRSYYDVVHERVFERAGMACTGFYRLDELPPTAAIGYLPKKGWRTNDFHVPVRGGGDGGAYSTASDIARFWTALFQGRIVPLDRVAEMVRPHAAGSSSRAYGLGFWLTEKTHSVQLEGYDAGISFRSTFNPSTESLYTVVSNTTSGAWPVARELRASMPEFA